MSETVETVRIVSDVEETGGFVLINKSDFDAEKHTLYGAEAKPAKAPKAKE